MNPVPDLPVEIRVGGRLGLMNVKPLVPYSQTAVGFLSELSRVLLNTPACRQFPDIVAFAYWCRAANLARMQREFDQRFKRLGRGLALHIAPANVPVNFAFSFAFGLLSGNANIVRMSEARFPQAELLCDEISRLFANDRHACVASMNCLIRYARNDETTRALSQCCHARIIWGGDRTVAQLRAMPTSPRCVDITFADRYSLCILAATAVLDASEASLAELAENFYKDAYFLDQNACSSPHLVLWLGNRNQIEAAMLRFWNSMVSILNAKYDIQPVQAVDKFVHLCRTAIARPEAQSFSSHGNLIYRIGLEKLPADIDTQRGQHGFFYEYSTEDLTCLTAIVDERYQTLSCFGVSPEKVMDFIRENGLVGVDRIVPVGKALDIGVIWDGYDVIATLSRIIHS